MWKKPYNLWRSRPNVLNCLLLLLPPPAPAMCWILLEPKIPAKAITDHKRTGYRSCQPWGGTPHTVQLSDVKIESYWAPTSSPETPKLKTARWIRKTTRAYQIYSQRLPFCCSPSTVRTRFVSTCIHKAHYLRWAHRSAVVCPGIRSVCLGSRILYLTSHWGSSLRQTIVWAGSCNQFRRLFLDSISVPSDN